LLHCGEIFVIATVTDKKSRILAQTQLVIDRLSRHRRAATGFAAVSALGMVAAFAVAPSDPGSIQLQTVVERLGTQSGSILSSDQQLFLREERILRGETLASLLGRLGVDDREAFEFIRTDRVAQNIARQLRPGKQVTARTDDAGLLQTLYFPLSGKDAAIVVSRSAGKLSAREQAHAPETRTMMRTGEIRYSLFGATDAAGIPDGIATQLAESVGGDIDFHRDLRKGDRFSIVYEMQYLQGQPVRSGRILAAEFTNDKKTFQAFWHATEDGRGGYYSADGKSLRKAFLRSPLEFSRVTSGFTSNRFHPVLQTWRAHKGVDYGAPVGTRVRAVADGMVEFAGRQGGYGNLVVIRHQGTYSTAYGHLNGFAPGIKKGTRIAQGETVGFVGQTGLASGPHLHYEFRIRDQQVNPLSVTLPTSVPLEASQLPRFKTAIAPLHAHIQMTREFSLQSASIE